MWNSIKRDVNCILKSKYFYMCISIVIISCIIYYLVATRESGVLSESKIDTVGMFIAGAAFHNTILDILAPMLPAIACIGLWQPYLKKNMLELKEGLCNGKYIMSRSISTFIVGGLVFAVGFLVYILICVVFNPNSQGEEILLFYDYSYIYSTNSFIYTIIYIARATLFGSIYSLFSMSFLLITKNISMYIIIPSAVYFCAVYLGVLFPPIIKEMIFWITPIYTFGLESLSFSEIKSIVELLSIFVVSIILIYYSYNKEQVEK